MQRVLVQDFMHELIVVDNHSQDGTAELAESIDDARIRLIRQPVNRGKGAAPRTGVAAAQAPFVLVHDADQEYEPADIARLLPVLHDGRADVVCGSRFIGSDERRVLYYWHNVGD